nr:MAG: hypothetical protein DIU67_07130 [Actinomycetota bacterium]
MADTDATTGAAGAVVVVVVAGVVVVVVCGRVVVVGPAVLVVVAGTVVVVVSSGTVVVVPSGRVVVVDSSGTSTSRRRTSVEHSATGVSSSESGSTASRWTHTRRSSAAGSLTWSQLPEASTPVTRTRSPWWNSPASPVAGHR